MATAKTLFGVARSFVRQMIDSARISRNLSLPAPDKDDLRTEPFLTLQEWLIQIERAAPGKRFLLCLDEYERLEEIVSVTNSRTPLNFLRHVMQHQTAWTLLFSGSHTLDEVATYWNDYLIGTRYIRLTYLEESEARELITHPVPDFPEIYTPAAVERIIYWTACQPYLVQLLCSELVDYQNKQHPQNALNVQATPEDVDAIIPHALVSGSPYFNEFWLETLDDAQRDLLRSLILPTPEHSDPASKHTKAKRRLIEKEILSDENNNVQFRVPIIKSSVTQKVTEESP